MEISTNKKPLNLGPAGPGLVSLLITAAFLFLPFVGTFLVGLLPASVAYSRFRFGLRGAVMNAIVGIALAGAVTSSYLIVSIIACMCLSGFALGDSLAKGGRGDLAVLKGTVAPFVIAVPVAAAYFISSGTTPGAVIGHWLQLSLQESIQIYRQMGMSQADIDKLTPSLQLVVKVITDYYPAIAVASVAVSSLASYAVARGRLVKGGLIGPSEAPVSTWKAPDHLVWGIIVPGFLLIPDVPELRVAAGNVLGIFALVYLFQGFAVLVHLFDRLKLSPVLRVLGLFLIFIQPFLIVGLWCIGFFDTWVDFRKLRPKKK